MIENNLNINAGINNNNFIILNDSEEVVEN